MLCHICAIEMISRRAIVKWSRVLVHCNLLLGCKHLCTCFLLLSSHAVALLVDGSFPPRLVQPFARMFSLRFSLVGDYLGSRSWCLRCWRLLYISSPWQILGGGGEPFPLSEALFTTSSFPSLGNWPAWTCYHTFVFPEIGQECVGVLHLVLYSCLGGLWFPVVPLH